MAKFMLLICILAALVFENVLTYPMTTAEFENRLDKVEKCISRTVMEGRTEMRYTIEDTAARLPCLLKALRIENDNQTVIVGKNYQSSWQMTRSEYCALFVAYDPDRSKTNNMILGDWNQCYSHAQFEKPVVNTCN